MILIDLIRIRFGFIIIKSRIRVVVLWIDLKIVIIIEFWFDLNSILIQLIIVVIIGVINNIQIIWSLCIIHIEIRFIEIKFDF